ncbi:MAG: NDP-sugar synthase [Acidobacteria bacterium]|nr:NDP-sugar synthase [Acidobacteriota bacterium]
MIDTAIVLAAGLGTRLAPLSWVRAKAALPVAGEPMIRRQLRWLAAAGVRRVVVNLHHRPATITSLVGHGDDLHVEVRYSWEPVVLGSAGGPRRAFDLLEAERAFVVNGDTLTDLDLPALAEAHARHRPLVTMAAIPAARAGYNALAVDPDGCFAGVTRDGALPPAALDGCQFMHFIGVQVAERAAFAAAPAGEPSEALKALYPALIAADPDSVRVWSSAVAFHDIGTPADYLASVQAIAAAEGGTLDRGVGTRVAPSADITGSVLWDDVTVGADAEVRDSILADGVTIPAGRQLSRVVVVARAALPEDAPGRADGDLWIAPLDASR